MWFVLVLFFIIGHCCADERDLRILDSIRQENACNNEGGICTIAKDCPKGQLTTRRGLCPAQQRQGVQCCYGVSVKETRCRRRGGDCFSPERYCSKDLTFKEATDCPEDFKCCILV